MQIQRPGSTLKCAMIFSLSSVVAVGSLAGCIDDEPGVVDGELTASVVSAVDRPLSPISPAACVIPPVFDQTVVQNNHGDVGGGATADSPDGSYFPAKGFYVVEVTSTINPFASSRMASAYGLQSNQSQSVCQSTTTTATFYGFDDSLGCWVKGPTASKLGVWHPAQPPFIPAECDDGVGWSFSTSISKVRIQGQSVRKINSVPSGQRIEEATSWIH